MDTVPAPRPNWKVLYPVLIAYFGFGLGYIAYMTFLIAYLRAHGASTGNVVAVWTALGLAMIAGGPVWRTPLAHWPGGRPMALMLALAAAGALLPLISDALAVLILSAALFGLATMPVVTALTVLIRRHLPIETWNLAIAVATVMFALGQSLGPLGSGLLSDHFGLKTSLVWTAVIASVSASIALLQKE
jgi:predicted MFS family arabinose efflux permease